ncbi:MAG: DUF58 domain-containing protein [Anaerolineaceae bacterium]|nr:DUF58 domain-containing protein [Anaerolineaceae bacterium]
MLPSDLLKAIRQIEIRTRRLVNEDFAGEYQASFKGLGMEFDEVREYQPGDEVRTIDWNVSARMGSPYVKRYIEERELTVILAYDASASGSFGTQGKLKRELAAEIGAVLAFSAISNNDKVGLLTFTDQIELQIPPRKGRKHVLRLIRELLAFEPQGKGTDLSGALERLNRTLKRKAIIFLISDFLIPEDILQSRTLQHALMTSNKKHDLVAINISDVREQNWPSVGLLNLQDAESGQQTWIDSSNPAWRNAFTTKTKQQKEEIERLFRKAQMDQIKIQTGEDYVRPLLNFFEKRSLKPH